MSLTYCEKFGFDADKIAERLQWLELGAADHATAQQFQQDIIQPHAEIIVAAFYEWLPTIAETQTLLVDDELVARLRQTQLRYLLNLGIAFDQADYFESRLRVGQAHVWVGLSLACINAPTAIWATDPPAHRLPHSDARKLTTFST